MGIIELFRLAITGLLSNRLRSLLTMLGIIIGVAAVISLMSFGQSFQDFVVQSFNSFGSNLVVVFPITPAGKDAKTLKAKPMTMSDVAAIADPSKVSAVSFVTPQFGVTTKLIYNGNDDTLNVMGTTPSWADVRNWHVTDGRFITDQDVAGDTRVIVIGTTTAKKLFGAGVNPLGEEIVVNQAPFTVIGVLQTKSSSFGSVDDIAVVPITTAQKRLGATNSRAANGEYRVQVIFAKAVTDNVAPIAMRQISAVLSQRHEIEFSGNEDFLVFSSDQILAILGNVTGLITAFLAVIAGISLLVGGIGVMNIMLVSVTERTREIGLRKAVGARYIDLMMQFLIESVVLCIAGAAIGVFIAEVVAFIAGKLITSLTLSVSVPSIILAAVVSTAIGVFFGIYPASRAASLNPIEALRYE